MRDKRGRSHHATDRADPHRRLFLKAAPPLTASLLMGVGAAGFGAGGALAGKTMLEAEKEAMREQETRGPVVNARGQKAYYTNTWDLGDLPRYKPEQIVSGTIRQRGSNYFTDSPLEGWWETAFKTYHPEIAFDTNLRTSEHAISALVFKVSDIGPMGRQIMWDERLSFQREFSYQPTGIVAVTGSYDVGGWNPAIGVVVNAKNPLSKLTMPQLDGIFLGPRSGAWIGPAWDKGLARGPEGNIRTWGQVGLTGEWADRPITPMGYNIEFHFSQEMTSKSMGGVTGKWNENLVEYSNELYPNVRAAGQIMMEDLAKDPNGIGYAAGATKWMTADHKLVALAGKEGEPYYDLTLENVRDRKYPFYADVFFWVNRDPKKPMDPKVREYLRFILSREGQEFVMKDGKYLPLTGEAVREQLKLLD